MKMFHRCAVKDSNYLQPNQNGSSIAGYQTDEDLMVKNLLFILFMLRGDLCAAVKRKDNDTLIQ